mmetsp:Transcript_122887/g.236936  ORF Transcript_122887/g.236936 Transcript_122887/m.236936 type:complete len:508 (-) Transcript_122887:47-1570(-)
MPASVDDHEVARVKQELKDALASNEKMLQDLQDAHACNEQLLSAQKRMLSSLFDASCFCDTMGCITECTHHMQQMLSNIHDNQTTLVGRHLSSFAVSIQEGERISDFLRQAAESTVHNAITIQASLVSGLKEPADVPFIRVKLFCIPLPSLHKAGSSEIFSETSGFFVGLQNLQNLDTDGTEAHDMQETEARDCSACNALPEDASEHCGEVEEEGEMMDLLSIALHPQSRDLIGRKQMANSTCPAQACMDPPSMSSPTEAFMYKLPLEDPSRISGNPTVLDRMSWVQALSPMHVISLHACLSDSKSLQSLSLSDSVPSPAQQQRSHTVRFSAQAHQRAVNVGSIETQMMTCDSKADAEVQTIVGAGKPPRRTRVLDERFRPSHRKKRRTLWKSLKATPRDIIRHLIVMNVVECINPVCPPCCCSWHTLLSFLRNEVASMLSSSPCRDWGGNQVQCLECLCLQGNDACEQEFTCDFCNGTEFVRNDTSDRASSSGAAADTENEHVASK